MKILVTGGAGFIGSNLIDYFLENGHEVTCFDNLSTGHFENIKKHLSSQRFTFIEDDIRDLGACKNAVAGCRYISHQAALGSVPRSVSDPITTNEVNITGFLNMLVASRDAKIKRFVYAASSSTYGDSKSLPKVEHIIGNPLSPYAITKYVNELYANVFSKTYGMQCIGLRYFNVFGKRQDPNGQYAAVIPLWVKKLINHESPIINGDGAFSRDFTYIENVVEANWKALFTSEEKINKGRVEYYNLALEDNKYALERSNQRANEQVDTKYFSEVFNVANGSNTTLLELFEVLKHSLSKYDKEIAQISPEIGGYRVGDIPHSQASIIKAETILGYSPVLTAQEGFELASKWYYNHI
jgi:UDP-N-acetylglucosamine/UDP-N-acetylgalactosamine 4-epimerase